MLLDSLDRAGQQYISCLAMVRAFETLIYNYLYVFSENLDGCWSIQSLETKCSLESLALS